MLTQTVQTPAQYRWLTKLLGFDFDIQYKPGSTNKPADALSRLPSGSCQALHVISKPELFKLQGTSLATSTAYHPQTDGQTEVLNRCLEDYLRAFVADHPKHWVQYLPWAEWSYNTAWHSAIKMTPFEAVFGRTPPSLIDYLQGTATVPTVDELLSARTQLLHRLQTNLQKAQTRMRTQANSKRTEVEFQVGDWVFLRLQPYRQSSLAHRQTNKLSRRFYGPFQISAKVGKVAYQLVLPSDAQIHNVFHVSLLKRCFSPPTSTPRSLPNNFMGSQPLLVLESILDQRLVKLHNSTTPQVLIKWQGHPSTDATWENLSEFKTDFPSFNLEGKVSFNGGGTDASQSRDPNHKGNGKKVTIGGSGRRSTRKKNYPNKLEDYV